MAKLTYINDAYNESKAGVMGPYKHPDTGAYQYFVAMDYGDPIGPAKCIKPGSYLEAKRRVKAERVCMAVTLMTDSVGPTERATMRQDMMFPDLIGKDPKRLIKHFCKQYT